MLKLNSVTFTTGRDQHKNEYTFSVGETVTLNSGRKAVIKNLIAEHDGIFAQLVCEADDVLLYVSIELLATLPEIQSTKDRDKKLVKYFKNDSLTRNKTLEDVKKRCYAGKEFGDVIEAYEAYKESSDNFLNSMLKFIAKGDTPGLERMQFDVDRGLTGVYTK